MVPYASHKSQIPISFLETRSWYSVHGNLDSRLSYLFASSSITATSLSLRIGRRRSASLLAMGVIGSAPGHLPWNPIKTWATVEFCPFHHPSPIFRCSVSKVRRSTRSGLISFHSAFEKFIFRSWGPYRTERELRFCFTMPSVRCYPLFSSPSGTWLNVP